MRTMAIVAVLPALLGTAILCGGCARGGEEESIVPDTVMDIVVTFAGPVRDAFYYYVAIDADGDFGADGPLPVAAGPNWGNGWGTGSMTHYVEYHQGRYELFAVLMAPQLADAGGGITAVSGVPNSRDAGVHEVMINSLNLGAATVTGDGAVASAANTGFQAAGALALSTNAAGEVVAGTVAWTPAAQGGRALTAAEQAAVDALNTGGVALAADSLDALGLSLTLAAGPDLSGAQTIEVAPTTANVTDTFTPEGIGSVRVTQATLPANNSGALQAGPIPGMTIVTGDLIVGESARIRLVPANVGQSLGFPYESTLPQGGSSLRVTLDLAQLGETVPDLSVNFISTTELIFDPTVVNPDEHTYDGLGRLGNDYFTLVTNQFQTVENGDLLVREEAGDPTLTGPSDELARAAVDIVDWRVTVRRLR